MARTPIKTVANINYVLQYKIYECYFMWTLQQLWKWVLLFPCWAYSFLKVELLIRDKQISNGHSRFQSKLILEQQTLHSSVTYDPGMICSSLNVLCALVAPDTLQLRLALLSSTCLPCPYSFSLKLELLALNIFLLPISIWPPVYASLSIMDQPWD